MKKKILIGIGILVVLAAIAFPWYLLQTNKAESEENTRLQVASAKFIGQYGTDVTIIKTEKLKDILATYWADAENMHISIELGSAWVEVYRAPLNTNNTTATNTEPIP
jgi:type II secretory pathway pseudopilin PulG